MRFFDRKTSLFLILICLPLLFLPKINLIRVGEGETAGLRIDDFILFFFAVILFWAHRATRAGLSPIEFWVIALTAFSLLSFLSNRFLVSIGYLHVDAKVYYTVRIFEYFLFFYIGALAVQFISLETIIHTFFGMNLFLMILQKWGVIGGFNFEGYFLQDTYRVFGIASFPSEMGALLNLIFCYFLFRDREEIKIWSWLPKSCIHLLKITYIYWLFLLFTLLVILTGSRIAIVALLLPFLFKLKSEVKQFRSIGSYIPLLCFFGCALVFLLFFINQTESISTRSKGLMDLRNFALVEEVWNEVNENANMKEYGEVYFDDYDFSWWIRIHKWCYALKVYCFHPECYLQGIGPGFAWSALDGGFIRILTEFGIIGTFLFWKFFASIYRVNQQLKWMVIAFMFNMIFFDAHLAYKAMSLLFLIAGYIYRKETASEMFDLPVQGSVHVPHFASKFMS